MEDHQSIEFEYWGLTGDGTGEAGLASLISRSDPRLGAAKWCVNLQGLKTADTVTATVTRRCIEIFRGASEAQVTIWPPAGASELLDRVHDFLWPPPERVSWAPAPDTATPVRDRRVIIPATPIGSDRELELYGDAVGRGLMGLHLPLRTIRHTAQALAELTANALIASTADGLSPIISVALDPSSSTIGVTVLGDPPELESPEAAAPLLTACVERSRERRGGWQRISPKPGATLTIAVGSARVTMSSGGEDYSSAAAVDAFCATWTMPIWAQ